jgi:hypothetical protein
MYVNDVKMQKMFITIIFIVLFTSFSFSCKTQDVGNNNIDLELYDVLIVGERIVSDVGGLITQEAVYWKNGELFILARNTSLSWPDITANSICLSGNDVYIAGQNRGKAVYWKNGRQKKLGRWYKSLATSIFVSDGDIYVAGVEFSGERSWVVPLVLPLRFFSIFPDISINLVSIYWKNNKAVRLSDGARSSIASGIVVSDSNVYVSGAESGKVMLWKNGEGTIIDNGYHGEALFVHGSDIYVAGSHGFWKNGEYTSLGDGYSNTLSSIFVNGTDIYAAGYIRKTQIGIAVYWKNGEETQLTDKDSIANSIYVIDNDVYVAGNERKPVRYFNNTVLNAEGVWTEGFWTDTYVNVATYWKNGIAVELPGNFVTNHEKGSTYAHDIIVVPRVSR